VRRRSGRAGTQIRGPSRATYIDDASPKLDRKPLSCARDHANVRGRNLRRGQADARGFIRCLRLGSASDHSYSRAESSEALGSGRFREVDLHRRLGEASSNHLSNRPYVTRAARNAQPRRLLLAGTAAFFVFRASLSIPRTGPLVVADEIGYLTNARVLAGGVPGQLSTAPFYHGGYSLLLAPVLRLGLAPETTYRMVLVLNALLAASLVPLLFLLLTRCFAVDPRAAVWPSLAAAAYPSVTILSQVALSESLLAPLIVAWLLCFGSLLKPGRESARIAWGAGVAISAVWLWATHGSMLVVVALTVLALLVVTLRHGSVTRPALVALAMVALGLVAVHFLSHFLVVRNYGGHTQSEIQHRLSTIDNPSGIAAFVRNLVGQAWYLAVASLGVLVAAAASLPSRRLRQLPRSPAEVVVALAVLAGLGLLVESALSFPSIDRPDMLIYGRYTEVLVPPLLAVALVRLGTLSRYRTAVLSTTIVLVSAAVALLRAGIHPARAANRWNVASLPAPTFQLGPEVLVAAGLVAAVVTVLLAVTRRRAAAAVAPLVLLLFLPTTAVVENNPVRSGQAGFYPSTWTNPPTLKGTVAFDTDDSRGQGLWVYQWFVSHARFVLFSGSRERPPARYVITNGAWTRRHAALRPTSLWRDPSRDYELIRLARPG